MSDEGHARQYDHNERYAKERLLLGVCGKEGDVFLETSWFEQAEILMKLDKEVAVGTLVDDSKAMRSDSRTVDECSPIYRPEE